MNTYDVSGASNLKSLKIKTRTETPKPKSTPEEEGYILWGTVSGLVSASKMAKEMEKIYKDRCYELKMVPVGEGRKVYHRPCE